jgi:hypothetical protein
MDTALVSVGADIMAAVTEEGTAAMVIGEAALPDMLPRDVLAAEVAGFVAAGVAADSRRR